MLYRIVKNLGLLSLAVIPPALWANATDRIAPAAVNFQADWTVKLDGVVVSDTDLNVNFDQLRLDQCRGKNADGFDDWRMQAFVSVDGKPAVSYDLIGGQGTPFLYEQKTSIRVPKGRDLALWFKGSDVTGCLEWDSNYGRNYHFAIQALEDLPVLDFRADWSAVQSAPIHAGQAVRLHYDLARSTDCRFVGYRGTATWDVYPHVAVDGKSIALPAVTFAKAWNERGQQDVIFTVPSGRDLSIWFEAKGYEYYTGKGCQSFDSQFGQNFHFSIQM